MIIFYIRKEDCIHISSCKINAEKALSTSSAFNYCTKRYLVDWLP